MLLDVQFDDTLTEETLKEVLKRTRRQRVKAKKTTKIVK